MGRNHGYLTDGGQRRDRAGYYFRMLGKLYERGGEARPLRLWAPQSISGLLALCRFDVLWFFQQRPCDVGRSIGRLIDGLSSCETRLARHDGKNMVSDRKSRCVAWQIGHVASHPHFARPPPRSVTVPITNRSDIV